MPPKLKPNRSLPVQHSSVFESTEERWRRLRPDWYASASGEWYDGWARADAAHGVQVPVTGTDPRRDYRTRPYSTATSTRAADHTLARHDASVVRHLRRGTCTDALAALEAEGVSAVVDALLQDRYSRSAAASNASLLKTWQRFRFQAFAHELPQVPLLPITARSLILIGALFKAGGYRSYPNYVSVLRGLHIDDGHDWGLLLQHTSAWVTRSVMRGIGPARQSCCFDLARLAALARSHSPLVDSGPCNPHIMAILAVLFLLREVEVSTSRVSSWKLSVADSEITWHLPSSKSDHLALGVRRTLPCFCGLDSIPCPYHLAAAHLDWLRSSRFADDGNAPLFPTSLGKFAAKASVVATFEQLGTACGQPLMSDEGLRLFGGHTPRVTGAQLYVAHGVEVNKVRVLARHSGDTILRYVQDAPLRSLRSDLGLPPSGMPDKVTLPLGKRTDAAGTTVAGTRRLTVLEVKMADLERTLMVHAQELDALNLPATGAPILDYVQNTTTRTVHQSSPSITGRTRCGLTYNGDTARARRRIPADAFLILPSLVDLPGDIICDRCLPAARKAAFSRDIIHKELSGDELPVDE